MKTHQIFSVHSAPGKLEKATRTGHCFGFVVGEILDREITGGHRFEKFRLQNESRRFQIPPV